MIVLLAGLVKIHPSVHGAEILLSLTGPGDLLGEAKAAARDDGPADVALPITQEELASWSASSRESTARALRAGAKNRSRGHCGGV
ncbi:MAG: helix-turn-helix domain-containing protein [Actinomycetota bacterium]|nr:helix-turn-helix domain-containing protein [Actinomycetota bacterium]